ncbi:MAG TPA: bifunctional DNA-formamidopyrimidine glycosylase/DNA-(apurinic or apyrimidinic site) lyase [Dehalococcoidales bacterium]
MPELPEVETTINDLKPDVEGRTIAEVEIPDDHAIATPSAGKFKKELAGQKIISLSRRGKHLLFKLDNGRFLIVHLRMTGSLLIKKATDEPEKFVRVIIRLTGGNAIHFRDPRRFGRMWLVDDPNNIVGNLGPEPLEADFTPAVLASILKGRKTPIKSTLLDQKLIAGIGNMYADEALYHARIHPLLPAGNLKKAEIDRLFEAIQFVLRQGIREKGASTETYIRPGGIKGEAHLQFRVAHQKGKTCPVCGGPIERIVVGQRGTFYCPRCQKLPAKRSSISAAITRR